MGNEGLLMHVLKNERNKCFDCSTYFSFTDIKKKRAVHRIILLKFTNSHSLFLLPKLFPMPESIKNP